MPIGVFVNVVSVVLGGLFGALAGHKLPASLKTELNVVFGVCSMGIGISSIVLMKNMPAVIFAVVVGTAVGLACRLGLAIRRGAEWMQKPIARLFHSGQGSVSGEEFSSSLVTLVVLFCASGTGIYGTLTSGMTGDHTILIAKSVLDLFTAAVFACNLGVVVSAVAVPQLIVFLRQVDFPAHNAGYDRRLQGVRRDSDACHRLPHGKDQGVSRCGYDSGYDSCHAGELAVERLAAAAAFLERTARRGQTKPAHPG